jgi:hypothetical protein
VFFVRWRESAGLLVLLADDLKPSRGLHRVVGIQNNSKQFETIQNNSNQFETHLQDEQLPAQLRGVAAFANYLHALDGHHLRVAEQGYLAPQDHGAGSQAVAVSVLAFTHYM